MIKGAVSNLRALQMESSSSRSRPQAAHLEEGEAGQGVFVHIELLKNRQGASRQPDLIQHVMGQR